jgi:hypothetical protein
MAIRSTQTVAELQQLQATPALINSQSFKVRRVIRAEVNKLDASGVMLNTASALVVAAATTALSNLT